MTFHPSLPISGSTLDAANRVAAQVPPFGDFYLDSVSAKVNAVRSAGRR